MVKTYAYHGKMMTISAISRMHGIKERTLRSRLEKGEGLQESIDDLVRKARFKNAGGKMYVCKASSIEDCFSCAFPDCIRDGKFSLKGEA